MEFLCAMKRAEDCLVMCDASEQALSEAKRAIVFAWVAGQNSIAEISESAAI